MRSVAWLAVVALWAGAATLAAAEGPAAKGAAEGVKKPTGKPDWKPKDPAAKKPDADDDPATRKIKEILKTKRVSFDFVETPFGDVLSFIQTLLGVNVVVAPDVDRKEPLTLRVADMNVGSALQWIIKLAGGKMEIRDGAIFVAHGRPGAAERKAPPAKKLTSGRLRGVPRVSGKAQIRVGDFATIEIYIDDDEIGPDIREKLMLLLKRTLREELEEAHEDEGDKGEEKHGHKE